MASEPSGIATYRDRQRDTDALLGTALCRSSVGSEGLHSQFNPWARSGHARPLTLVHGSGWGSRRQEHPAPEGKTR